MLASLSKRGVSPAANNQEISVLRFHPFMQPSAHPPHISLPTLPKHLPTPFPISSSQYLPFSPSLPVRNNPRKCPFLCTFFHIGCPFLQYRMSQRVLYYRGPGSLNGRMIWLNPHPIPLSRDTQEDWERETTCWRERGGGGELGAKSYDRKKAKKAWSSIYHSILYGVSQTTFKVVKVQSKSYCIVHKDPIQRFLQLIFRMDIAKSLSKSLRYQQVIPLNSFHNGGAKARRLYCTLYRTYNEWSLYNLTCDLFWCSLCAWGQKVHVPPAIATFHRDKIRSFAQPPFLFLVRVFFFFFPM